MKQYSDEIYFRQMIHNNKIVRKRFYEIINEWGSEDQFIWFYGLDNLQEESRFHIRIIKKL